MKLIEQIKLLYTSKNSLWILRCVFFLYAFLVLGVLNYDVLYQLFWKNYFIFNQVFYKQTFFQSGGLLIYVARFLNQLFYYPILAAIVIAALLTFLECLVSKWMDPLKQHKILCFVPSVLLLHELTTVAYALYDKLEIAYFFAPMLGMLFVLIMYSIYIKIKERPWGAYSILVLSAVLFPWIGFYSLTLGLVVSLLELNRGKKVVMPVCLLISITAVWISSRCYSERLWHVILSPLPDPFFVELFMPTLLASLLLVVLPLLNDWKKSFSPLISLLGYLAMMVALFAWNMNDSHSTFRKEMRLSRFCDQQDWQSILKNINRKERITHAMNAYRVIALANTNELGEKLFSQMMPFKDSPSEYRSEATIYYPDIYFYSSFFTVSCTATFEQWVTFGETYKLLKMLAFNAILIGDDDLARRYVSIMKQAPCLRSLAKEMESAIGREDTLVEKFPFCKVLLKNQFYQDLHLSVQYHFAKNFTFFQQLDGVNIERRIYANLFLGNIKEAISDVKVARQVVRYFPACVQEVFVLMYLDSKNLDFMRQIPIDRNLAQRVQSLVSDFYSQKSKDPQVVATNLFDKYGDLYSYYYLTNYGLK